MPAMPPDSAGKPIDIQAEASVVIRAPRAEVWKAIIDLSRRPTLKSWKPISGSWPTETATALTVMDKGETDMTRTETVVRLIPEQRLLIKVQVHGADALAWLDHRLADADGGCLVTMSVIVASGPLPVDRAAYAAGTTTALADVLRDYAKQF